MRPNLKPIQLPKNFAEELLKNEIEVKLNRQPMQSHVCALLQLYSAAFQYYESNHNYKYRYFQLKMKEIFAIRIDSQQVSAQNGCKLSSQDGIMNGLQESKLQDIFLSQSQIKEINKKTRQQERIMHQKIIAQRTSSTATNQEMKALISEGNMKAIEFYTNVKFELEMQDHVLKEKIEARHSKVLKKTRSQNNILKQTSTKASLLSLHGQKGEFLEQIKENYFEQYIRQDDEYENDARKMPLQQQ